MGGRRPWPLILSMRLMGLCCMIIGIVGSGAIIFLISGLFMNWMPHPTALVEDLQVFAGDGHARYLVLPDTAVARPFIRAVEGAGFQLEPVYRTPAGEMILYQIQAENTRR